MHNKALNLLREFVSFFCVITKILMGCRLSEKEDDLHDKLMPTISYLQKLGPEHLEQIFKSARWVFEMNQDMAFQVISWCLSLDNLLIG